MKSLNQQKQTISILFLLLSLPFSLYSENVLLKRGGIVKGKIIEQDQNKIKIQKEDGTTTSISKGEILKVVYKEHLSAGEEDKLIKAEEAKALVAAEKELKKKEKEDAERLKKEMVEQEKLNKDSAGKKAAEDAERKKKADESERLAMEGKKNLTRGGATWRSAVLPGWGQYRQGRKVQSVLYPSLIAVGLFFTYQQNRYFLNAKNDYSNLNNPYTNTGIITTGLGLHNGTGTAVSTAPVNPLVAYEVNERNPLKGQKEAVEKHYRQLQYIGGATVALYLWNVLDAFIFHPKQNLADLEEPEAPQNQFFMKTAMDRLDAVPYSSILEQRYETKTNLGYEFLF